MSRIRDSSSQMLKCKHKVQSVVDDEEITNGVKPIIPFSEEELEGMRAKGIVDVEVRSHRFIGMSMPETYIVRMQFGE